MTPIDEPRNVAPIPTASDMRAPWTIRLQTSRPNESVPSQCSALGGASRCVESTLSGSKRQIRSADIATQTNITITNRPMVPSM